MVYNLGSTRSRIEQKLDDTSFGVDKLNQFINDGQRDILNARRFVFMEREADLTTNIGLDSVNGTPTDMQVPLTLRVYTPVGNAIQLQYVEYEDFDRALPNPTSNGTSAPSQWRVFNQDIIVYPLSDVAYTLKLKYIKEPAELVIDSDVPEIPESFGEILVLAGFKRALEHNDDYDQAQIIQLQIDEKVDTMDNRYKRQSGEPHIIANPLRTGRQRFGGR